MTIISKTSAFLAGFNWFVIFGLIASSLSPLASRPGGAHPIISIFGTLLLLTVSFGIIGFGLLIAALIKKEDKKRVLIGIFLAHGVYLGILTTAVVWLARYAMHV